MMPIQIEGAATHDHKEAIYFCTMEVCVPSEVKSTRGICPLCAGECIRASVAGLGDKLAANQSHCALFLYDSALSSDQDVRHPAASLYY